MSGNPFLIRDDQEQRRKEQTSLTPPSVNMPAPSAPSIGSALTLLPGGGIGLNQQQQPVANPLPEMRSFGDISATRRMIFDRILNAASNLRPVENQRYALTLSDVHYAEKEDPTPEEVKRAILEGGSTVRTLRGVWTLQDKLQGKVSKRKTVIAKIPYLLDNGTFLRNGTKFVLRNQSRLLPGVYAKRKENGENVVQINADMREGSIHHYGLDQDTGQLNVLVSGSKTPIFAMAMALGATDDEMKAAWGDDLFAVNKRKFSPTHIAKLHEKFVRGQKVPAQRSDKERLEELRASMERIRFDPDVMEVTLGNRYDHLNKDVLLAATKKLIGISRWEIEGDERDNMAFQEIWGPEDIFEERLSKDSGSFRRQLLSNLTYRYGGDINKLPAGALTKQVDAAILGSGLGGNPEEINALEIFDKAYSLTKLGSGALPSIDSVPDESRDVHPTYRGFVDPARSPESLRVGVDTYLASASRKGADRQIYTSVTDLAGEQHWLRPKDLLQKTVAVASEYRKAADDDYIPVLRKGKEEMAQKKDVDYLLPYFEQVFSPLANLVPFKSATQGNRVSMGSRMLTQAMPLSGGEAPLVQTGYPGRPDWSYYKEFGKEAGAVFAEQPGTVIEATDQHVLVENADGTQKKIMLQRYMPSNRKSVTGDTSIVIRRRDGRIWRGMIEDYERETGDQVRTIDDVTYQAGWGNVTAFLKLSAKDKRIVEVRTKTGRKVKITDDHSLVTLDADGRLIPIFPADCKIGETRLPIVPLDLSFTNAISDRNDYVSGLLAGIYLADGHLVVSGQSATNNCCKQEFCTLRRSRSSEFAASDGIVYSPLHIASDSLERHAILKSWLASVSRGKNPPVSHRAKLSKTGVDGVTIYDAELCQWIFNNFGRLAHGKYIHNDIFSKSEEFRKGLIVGFFSGDGCLWADTFGNVQLEAFIVSQRLRDDLIDILASLGVMTTVVFSPRKHIRKQWRDAYGLRVCSDYISKLDTWFAYPDRQEKLEAILAACEGRRKLSPHFWMIPIKEESVEQIISMTPEEYLTSALKKNVRRRDHKSRAAAKRYLLHNQSLFGRWANSEVNWDTIVDIRPMLPVEYVYDLSVDGFNCFCVDHGLLVHNTFSDQEPTVTVGQRVAKGDLLVRSNMTDDKGQVAVGRNARVVMMPWKGLNFEDGMLVSQSFADKMRSQHMYQHRVDWTPEYKQGRHAFMGIFPTTFDKRQLDQMDDTGLVKPGTVLKKGDPIILAARATEGGKQSKKANRRLFSDASLLWEHHDDGIVTDVYHSKKGSSVLVRMESALKEGDKIANRYGNKGVVRIVPDDEMPMTEDGMVAEVAFSPLGTPSRGNPAQVAELALGKIAMLTGKTYHVSDFDDIDDVMAFVDTELEKHGISADSAVIDRKTGKKIYNGDGSGIPNGSMWLVKVHHTSESKGSARGIGGYSSDESPAKGGESGAKRMAPMHLNALVSHGAYNTFLDAKYVRGQANEDFWIQYMRGITPEARKTPLVYEKFENSLKASGINVKPDEGRLNVLAMTTRDVEKLAEGREVKSGETLRWEKDKSPVMGGLFDPAVFGMNGDRWGKITPVVPILNPVMEEPARILLGLKQKEIKAVMQGKQDYGHYGSGFQAIGRALADINIPRAMSAYRNTLKHGNAGERDRAVRALGYLKACESTGVGPGDWMLNSVPVIPPKFRPVSEMVGSKVPLIADANYLYKLMIDTNNGLKELRKYTKETKEDEYGLYNTYQQVTGLADPTHPKLVQREVRGLLKHVFGVGSSKFSMVQRNLLGTPTDMVGRAVVTPDPDLGLDQVGLPEGKAWEAYRVHVVHRLTKRGVPWHLASKMVEEHNPIAKEALLQEMEERPVLVDRAPVLHKWGILAFKPKLVTGDAMRMNTFVNKGYNMDNDGDALNFHVPMSSDAVKEAFELLLPSKSLIQTGDMKSAQPRIISENLGGLFLATLPPDKKEKTRTFVSWEDAEKAYRRGDLAIDDPVVVLSSRPIPRA